MLKPARFSLWRKTSYGGGLVRILLVEDDDKTATAVRTSLTAAGYVVDHETDGEQAWFRGDTCLLYTSDAADEMSEV